jgi:hypothetical protein
MPGKVDPFASLEQDPAAPVPEARKTVDLTGFGPKARPAIDRGAADAARRAGEEAGFSSRSRTAPRRAPTSSGGRSRLSDVVGRDVIEGAKAQLNILAPEDLCVRFKEIQRRRGDASSWKTLSAALDALEAQND